MESVVNIYSYSIITSILQRYFRKMPVYSSQTKHETKANSIPYIYTVLCININIADTTHNQAYIYITTVYNLRSNTNLQIPFVKYGSTTQHERYTFAKSSVSYARIYLFKQTHDNLHTYVRIYYTLKKRTTERTNEQKKTTICRNEIFPNNNRDTVNFISSAENWYTM